MGAGLSGAVGSVAHPEVGFAAFRMDSNFVIDPVSASSVINVVKTTNGVDG